MKNHKSLFHTVLGVVRKELEITLAVLVLLAFVVGFSFAQATTTEPAATDTQVAATQSSNLIVGGKAYQGLTFGTAKTGYIKVSKLTGGAQYISGGALTLVDSSLTYTLKVSLEQELDASKWYIDYRADKPTLTVNGQAVTSPTQPITLTGAKEISIVTKGGIDLISFSKTPGTVATPTDISKTVATAYLAPSATTITAGQVRNFILVALDDSGSSIDAKAFTTWTVSNSAIATINKSTGALTAIAPGTVQVTAKIGDAVATATVTVQPKEEQAEIVNEPSKEAIVALPITSTTKTEGTETTTATPTSDSATTVAEKTEATSSTTATQTATAVAVDKAVASIFSPAAVAARVVETGSAIPRQTEINKAAATIPSAVARFSFRLGTAVKEIALTLKTIAVGHTAIDQTTGTVVKTPSAGSVIANFIGNLIGLGNGANAGTLRIGGGGSEDLPN